MGTEKALPISITNTNIQYPNIQRKYPIGIANLNEIIQEGYLLVDKTKFIFKLISTENLYFLARPRRFGKTLTENVLLNLFLGNHEIFKGLYIEPFLSKISIHPVINISFGGGAPSLQRFKTILKDKVNKLAIEHKILLISKEISEKFIELIAKIYQKEGKKVVLLIDEYDKPILDNLANDDAEDIRKELSSFYAGIKDCDKYLRFVFITGVTRFNRMSLFSGLNNLRDISLSKEYADICGYTEDELNSVFAPELNKLDYSTKQKLKSYYNGYNFGGSEKQNVYAPQDILQFFAEKNEFANYWIQTGNTSSLIKLLNKRNETFALPAEIKVSSDIINGTYETNNLPIEVLLFQAGYLTIKSSDNLIPKTYTLDFPNESVRSGFKVILEQAYIKDENSLIIEKLKIAFKNLDFQMMREAFNDLFSTFSYLALNRNSTEFDYSNLLFMLVSNLGRSTVLDCQQERDVGSGRADIVVKLNSNIILILELKKESNAKAALDQIKTRNYVASFANFTGQIYGIGINITGRQIDDINYKKLK